MGRGQQPPASSEHARRTMQANPGKNTQPELLLRRLLCSAGYPGYRLHWKKVPGRPDIAYPGRRVAIFVNGCFWHACPCCRKTMPATNVEFWAEKLAATKERDLRHVAELKAFGWRVLTVWECQLARDPAAETARVVAILREQEDQVASRQR